MVSDEIVYDTLLTQLLCRHGGAQLGSSAAQPLDPAAGIIVDGFPRTAGQVCHPSACIIKSHTPALSQPAHCNPALAHLSFHVAS